MYLSDPLDAIWTIPLACGGTVCFPQRRARIALLIGCTRKEVRKEVTRTEAVGLWVEIHANNDDARGQVGVSRTEPR